MKPWQKSRWLPDDIRDAALSYTPEGVTKCRWCQGEVTPPRRSFCSDECVHEWSLRTSNAYLREHVYNRDKGVCSECSLDTAALRREINGLRSEARSNRLLDLNLSEKRFKKSLWEADHALPVAEGGGCSGLSNIQTLCWKCHASKTADQRKR